MSRAPNRPPLPGPYVERFADHQLTSWLGQLPAVLIVGPRACGKTTTARRHAKTMVNLDDPGQSGAFRADPDAALRDLGEPVLLDEWQVVPEVLGAVRRSVDSERRPGRYLVTGSVRAAIEQELWPGTGRLTRVTMFPLTQKEQIGRSGEPGFLERLTTGKDLVPDATGPDVRDYVGLALSGGFPEPALRLTGTARQTWLESYVTDLLSRDVWALDGSATRKRDPMRLRRYFEAYALNAAGVPEHSTIYTAAGINLKTADAYQSLLTDLFAIEQVPAWTSNRLKRLVRSPKRYVIDPGVWGAALRIDSHGVLADSNLLGRLLDTFVAAQLRPEVQAMNARLWHVRTPQGRQEIDLLIELSNGRLIALEVKATAGPTPDDARHLSWFRERNDERFIAGVVLHTGPNTYTLGDRITAAPISTFWSG